MAEISANFAAPEYPGQFKDWQALHGHAGSPPEKLDLMPQVLREQLGVIGPEETQHLMLQSGFQAPIPFFQSFLARGWHAVK